MSTPRFRSLSFSFLFFLSFFSFFFFFFFSPFPCGRSSFRGVGLAWILEPRTPYPSNCSVNCESRVASVRSVAFPFHFGPRVRFCFEEKREREKVQRGTKAIGAGTVYEYRESVPCTRTWRSGSRWREGERERRGRKEERDRMKRIERPFKEEIRDRYQNGVARERRVLYGDPSSGFYDGVTPP